MHVVTHVIIAEAFIFPQLSSFSTKWILIKYKTPPRHRRALCPPNRWRPHFRPLRSLLVDLGGEVVPDVAHGVHGVLDHDRDVGRHAQGHGGTQGGGLGEERQVAQGEVELHGLLHVDDHGVVLLLHVRVVLQHDVACAQIAGRREADALLRYGNCACEMTNVTKRSSQNKRK